MPIITIYQGASGEGQELAEAVAESLGYRCVGREVLVEASRRYGIPEAKLNDIVVRKASTGGSVCCKICGPTGSLFKLRCASWLTTARWSTTAT